MWYTCSTFLVWLENDDDHRGVFEKYNVRVMGTPLEAIIATEDREVFAQELVKINEKIAPSVAARSLDEALKAAEKIGNDTTRPTLRARH
jgi:carbamoylphosphate synthase large subunit